MLSIVPLEYDTKENMGKTRGILTSIPESTLMIEKKHILGILLSKKNLGSRTNRTKINHYLSLEKRMDIQCLDQKESSKP